MISICAQTHLTTNSVKQYSDQLNRLKEAKNA